MAEGMVLSPRIQGSESLRSLLKLKIDCLPVRPSDLVKVAPATCTTSSAVPVLLSGTAFLSAG